MPNFKVLLLDDRFFDVEELEKALREENEKARREKRLQDVFDFHHCDSRKCAERYLLNEVPSDSMVVIVSDLYMKNEGFSEAFTLFERLTVKSELLKILNSEQAKSEAEDSIRDKIYKLPFKLKLLLLRMVVNHGIAKYKRLFGKLAEELKRRRIEYKILIYSAFVALDRVDERAKRIFQIYLGVDSIKEKLGDMKIEEGQRFDKYDSASIGKIIGQLKNIRRGYYQDYYFAEALAWKHIVFHLSNPITSRFKIQQRSRTA